CSVRSSQHLCRELLLDIELFVRGQLRCDASRGPHRTTVLRCNFTADCNDSILDRRDGRISRRDTPHKIKLRLERRLLADELVRDIEHAGCLLRWIDEFLAIAI